MAHNLEQSPTYLILDFLFGIQLLRGKAHLGTVLSQAGPAAHEAVLAAFRAKKKKERYDGTMRTSTTRKS